LFAVFYFHSFSSIFHFFFSTKNNNKINKLYFLSVAIDFWHLSCKTSCNGSQSAKKLTLYIWSKAVDRALFIAMTGAKHTMLAQANRANNLANLSTTGFRADFEQSRAMGVYYGEGKPTRAYALTESPQADFTLGAMMATGNELDVAIQGLGFIAVQSADGSEAYTRAGNFSIDAQGALKTQNGLMVLGDGGPINIPENEKITIGADGTISIVGLGQGPESAVQVGRIKLVNPDIKNVEKGDDGLFRQRNGLSAVASADVKLRSGMLEGSNVNAIAEFTQILSLARQYEMQVRVMKAAEENSTSSTQLLQAT
jgi:flagellar basal-body rod protein FlgF